MVRSAFGSLAIDREGVLVIVDRRHHRPGRGIELLRLAGDEGEHADILILAEDVADFHGAEIVGAVEARLGDELADLAGD